MLVGLYGVESDAVHIINGGREGRDVDKVGCARLKFERQFGKGGFLEADVRDHLASTLIWGHLLKIFLFAVKHPYAGGAIHLVSREGVEINAEIAHVDFHVGCCLSAVAKHRHSKRMGVGCHLLYRIDRAEHVGNMGESHHAGAFGEEFLVSLDVE